MNRRRVLQMLAGVPFASSILATAGGVARESHDRDVAQAIEVA
jgi:hypothetical protein